MLFTKWGPSNNQNLTDGRTDGQTEIINLIVGLVTRKKKTRLKMSQLRKLQEIRYTVIRKFVNI